MKGSRLRERAKALRREGASLRDISLTLSIARSTASIWVKDVVLSRGAQQKIIARQIAGAQRGGKILLERRRVRNKKIEVLVNEVLPALSFTKKQYKGICALLYGCEGSKLEKSRVAFTNSDPELIRYFLTLFRSAFPVDEKKFRALVHLHSYHDENKQIQFWSEITQIPPVQFSRSYQKKNSGRTTRAGYPGCISIRYYDAAVQAELVMLYRKMLLQKKSRRSDGRKN